MQLASSPLMSHFERDYNTEIALHEKAVLVANCMVLANYDKGKRETYLLDQIKADRKNQLLVDTSSLDLVNKVSQYSRGWMESLTNLEETAVILEKICGTVFENAQLLGNIIIDSAERSPLLLKPFEKAANTAIIVFAGLIRMKNTYEHQYANDQENEGFRKLKQLEIGVTTWGNTIGEIYKKVFPKCTDFQYSESEQCLHVIEDDEDGKMLKKLSLDLFNQSCVEDQQYYASLYNICCYDVQGTGDYAKHQLKVSENTKLIVPTQTIWSMNNLLGNLSTLDKTAAVIKEHMDRAKVWCETHFTFLSSTENLDKSYRDMIEREIRAITGRVLPGLRRMQLTYNQKYRKKPNHPGLKELDDYIHSLDWAAKCQFNQAQKK